MPSLNKPMRYAHSEGLTEVCYDPQGKNLITGGSDGDVRVYSGFDEDADAFRVGEHVYALAVSQEPKVVAASEDNCVKVYTFPEGSPDGLLLRFTGSVNHITFSPSGKLLAAASSDFSVKTVMIKDCSQKVFKGHEAPVLSVAVDPKEEFLASSSCDGTVRIWNLDDQSCLKTFSLLPKTNDISQSKTLCRLAWRPSDGKHLAIPVDKEIKLYERNNWNHIFTLTNHTELVSVVSWSPCGQFLASASVNGELLVWNMKTKKTIESEKHESSLTICCLAWNPKNNGEIAFTDKQGQLGILESSTIAAEVSKGTSEAFSFEDGLLDDDDDDALMNSSMLNDASDEEDLVGKKKPRRIKNIFLEDEADESNDGVAVNPMLDEIDDDDDDEGDISKLKAELAVPMDFNDDETATNDGASVITETKIPKYTGPPPVILQPTFQPGSTPAHLMSRFMVWNSVGIVRCHTEDDISSIDVEFHDTSTHHAMHLTNHMNHTMAALSSTAVLLACIAQDDLPSKVVCLHFGAWDNSKQWMVSMPVGEDIQAIAVSEDWAAIVTDLRNLRLFTIGGIQRHIMSLPGPVVCMSAHGSQLLVVYHAGSGLPGEQCYGFKLLDIKKQKQIITNEHLPVSVKTTLSWLGFSAEGTPAFVDSKGIIRLLDRSFGHTWVPVANTKTNIKGKSDNYWVVGLNENPQQLRCIYCKGSTYPPTVPRPVLVILPFQIQLCELGTEKGQLEESHLRNCIFSNQFKYNQQHNMEHDEVAEGQSQTERTQHLMKLFALACKTEREFRAVEICQLLPGPHEVSLAIKYAARTRKMNLAKRLEVIARNKAEEENEEEEDDDIYMGQEDTYSSNHYSNDYDMDMYRGQGNQPKQRRKSKKQMNEDDDEVEEESEEVHDDEDDDNSGRQPVLARKLGNIGASNTKKPESYSLTSSQGSRINPFKVGSATHQSKGSTGKGFFDSVENEKNILAAKAKSPDNYSQSKNKPKQGTLLKPRKTSKSLQDTKTTQKVPPEPSSLPKKILPFNLWLNENKPVFEQENPDMDGGEVVKLAAKQWRELSPEKKKEWTEKAKAATSGQKNESQNENEEKKRKRDESDEDRSDKQILDENMNDGNATKKMKPVNSGNVNSKLAGFAFLKKN